VVTFSNVGKSPALALEAGVTVEVVDADKWPSLSVKTYKMPKLRLNMLFPGESSPLPSNITTMNSNEDATRSLNADEVKRLTAGKAYIAAFGIVPYRDQFGLHWTRFCSWKSFQTGPGNFNAERCILWNDAGDGFTKWGSPGDQK